MTNFFESSNFGFIAGGASGGGSSGSAKVVLNPINFVPNSTGNTQYLNSFVIDPNGDKWFIDYIGNAIICSSDLNWSTTNW